MGPSRPNLLQGNFKHLGAMAGQGPAAQPAAVVPVIHADYLVELIVALKLHTVPLAGSGALAGTEKGGHEAVVRGRRERSVGVAW